MKEVTGITKRRASRHEGGAEGGESSRGVGGEDGAPAALPTSGGGEGPREDRRHDAGAGRQDSGRPESEARRGARGGPRARRRGSTEAARRRRETRRATKAALKRWLQTKPRSDLPGRDPPPHGFPTPPPGKSLAGLSRDPIDLRSATNLADLSPADRPRRGGHGLSPPWAFVGGHRGSVTAIAARRLEAARARRLPSANMTPIRYVQRPSGPDRIGEHLRLKNIPDRGDMETLNDERRIREPGPVQE